MKLFIFSILMLFTLALHSAIITSAGIDWSNVNYSVSVAHQGDTVLVPSGVSTWTNAEMAVQGITIKGAGIDQSIILEDLPPTDGFLRLFNCTPVTTNLTRITGFTFANGGDNYKNFNGKIEFDCRNGPGNIFRCDHCLFTNIDGLSISVHGNPAGLIDHCSFYLQGTAIYHQGMTLSLPYGDQSYSDAPDYGTTNHLVIENNYFTNLIPGSSSSAAFDSLSGGRSTFRYNQVYNTFWSNHGNDTGGRYRGARQFEIYNNTFIDDQGFVTAMDFRSGSGVIFSNTATGYSILGTMENYRSVEGNYWGGANGYSPWDSNSTSNPFFTGTNVGVNLQSAVFTNVNWTNNQWLGYVLNDKSASNAPSFMLIQSSGSNSVSFTAPKDLGPMTVSNGDICTIDYCYPSIDQVGRGSGDLISGDVAVNNRTGTAAWPLETLEGVYQWQNTLGGGFSYVTSGFTIIQQGRDYYTNTVKSGYSSLIYPHPLDVPDSPVQMNLIPIGRISIKKSLF